MENGLTWNNFNIFAIFINNNGMCLDNFIMLPKSLLFSVKLKSIFVQSQIVQHCFLLLSQHIYWDRKFGSRHEPRIRLLRWNNITKVALKKCIFESWKNFNKKILWHWLFKQDLSKKDFPILLSIWVFFHVHLWSTGQQGRKRIFH